MGVRMAPVSASGLTPSWTILLRAVSGGAHLWGGRVRVRHFSRVVFHVTVHPRAALKGPRQPRCHARHVAASSARGVKALHRQHGSLRLRERPEVGAAGCGIIGERILSGLTERGIKAHLHYPIHSPRAGRVRRATIPITLTHPRTPSLLTLAACTCLRQPRP